MKKQPGKKMESWQVEDAVAEIPDLIWTAHDKGSIEVIYVIIIRPDGKRLQMTWPKEERE